MIRHVKILGGMREFVGKTGIVIGYEMSGRQKMLRVRLDEPVLVEGVGWVEDDLWEPRLLRTVQPGQETTWSTIPIARKRTSR
jgi:hypothetical protein